MENRIEINGVWYVREDAIEDPLDYLEEEEIDPIFSEECTFETDKYCFVDSRIKKVRGDEFYPDISITFTDKRSENRDAWKKEYWGNNNWLKEIIEENPESISIPTGNDKELCSQGKRQFKALLNILVEEGWLV
jgi:hypothetical protein